MGSASRYRRCCPWSWSTGWAGPASRGVWALVSLPIFGLVRARHPGAWACRAGMAHSGVAVSISGGPAAWARRASWASLLGRGPGAGAGRAGHPPAGHARHVRCAGLALGSRLRHHPASSAGSRAAYCLGRDGARGRVAGAGDGRLGVWVCASILRPGHDVVRGITGQARASSGAWLGLVDVPVRVFQRLQRAGRPRRGVERGAAIQAMHAGADRDAARSVPCMLSAGYRGARGQSGRRCCSWRSGAGASWAASYTPALISCSVLRIIWCGRWA